MKMTYTEIRKRIQLLWPDLEQIWMFDQSYEVPTLGELEAFISEHPLNNIPGDCDDWVLQYMALIRKHHYRWPFGEAFTSMINGFPQLHQINICPTEEGIYLYDAKDNILRIAEPNRDTILWVRI